MAEAVRVMAGQQRYEEAAVARDEAERLRALLERHRQVVSLRLAGRVVLDVEDEGEVVLDGGLWVEGGSEGAGRPDLRGDEGEGGGVDGDDNGLDHERAIVAGGSGPTPTRSGSSRSSHRRGSARRPAGSRG